ncbi:hypothetical protein OJAV_G00092340 [Oryzias javanicus]|uniref:BTB domain-containing protein n=1 Tax=Oryzias javanicus TaxID=123683 RepID=A0A437D0I1_ORYJA|nr:hypothetical protein OJAV_G00092340 [Oryzias javanicus]
MIICNTAAFKLEKYIQEMDDGSYIEFDVPEFSNTVLTQLNELRLQGKLCDIIVHVQGQPFRAHKAVLAASSPYFRDHSALSTMSGLSISVIKSPEVFEQLLAFCYTGHMSLQLKDIISFLTAASFLQMQAIIDKCTQILEGIHSKISLPVNVCSPGKETLQTSRNGVNDSNLFINPTQISPPYYSRHIQAGHEARLEVVGKAQARVRQNQEEAQSDRGSSDSVSEHDAAVEVETEQVELIGKDGQVTDVHVKIEKGTLNQHLRKKHMGASEVSNHMDSPERTEGESSCQKKREDTSEGMVFETQYAEEAPANDIEESSKCSPEEAQASRCDF